MDQRRPLVAVDVFHDRHHKGHQRFHVADEVAALEAVHDGLDLVENIQQIAFDSASGGSREHQNLRG